MRFLVLAVASFVVLAVLLFAVAIPFANSVSTGPLSVGYIYSNISSGSIYQGSAVLLKSSGATGGRPAYTSYRWYIQRPNTNYSSAWTNSSSTYTIPVTYVYRPVAQRDPAGVYRFKLQVKDQAGDVANSSTFSIRVLAVSTTTIVPRTTNTINAPSNSVNFTATLSLSNSGATEIAYNNTDKSLVVYTDSPQVSRTKFSDLEIQSNSVLLMPPTGYVPISYEYFDASGYTGNVFVNATLPYPCNVSFASVLPYQYPANNWQQIGGYQVFSNSCTIRFTVEAPILIALMQPYQPSTVASTTTIPAQVKHAANNSTSGQKSSSGSISIGGYGTNLYIGVAAIIIAIILVIVLIRHHQEQSEYMAYKKKGPQ